jgi:hypothetical protein
VTSPSARINRTFVDVSEGGDINEQALEVARLLGQPGLGWDQLYESPRILIFSEAGVGKTYECQAEPQRLSAGGEPAFFIELAQLARKGLREMLSSEEEARLDAWAAAQSGSATFFLDSYDELKLTLGSFRQALIALGKALEGNLARARIVITTRPIPVDERLFQNLLPVPDTRVASGDEAAFAELAINGTTGNAPATGRAKVWRRVVLTPLRKEQILAMAIGEGLSPTEADAMMADIQRRHAMAFAERPQDLIELCHDWRTHQRIRSHRDQMAGNVAMKLRARTDRPEKAALSPDRALEGARRLALAALLTRKLTLRHSAESDRGDHEDPALDPATILTDWTPEQRETLLERPLFGFATYGRVRFHHRSVVEYLAAEQLRVLLGRGMPRRALNRLLFASTAQGDAVLKPSLRPVTAWLASADEAVFEEVLRREPDVALTGGDPQSLTPAQRARTLTAYVERHGRGGWRGLETPAIQVRRFADPHLSGSIRQAWADGIENPEVRELILELVAAAPIEDCADLAHGVAINPEATSGERIAAIEALVALSDPRLRGLAASIAADSHAWGARLSRWAAMRLFPAVLTVPEMLCVLSRIRESKRTVAGVAWQLPQLLAKTQLDSADLDALRSGLTDLVFDGVVWQAHDPHLQSPRPYLVPALAAVCVRQLRARSVAPGLYRSVAIALRLSEREFGEEKPSDVLRAVLEQESAAVRAAVFAAEDELMQALHPRDSARERASARSRSGSLRLSLAQDRGWLCARLRDVAEGPDDRAFLLETALRLWDGDGDFKDYAAGLRSEVSDQADLLAEIDARCRPAKRDRRWAAYEAKMIRRRKKEARNDLKAKASWIGFWREVTHRPEEMFAEAKAENTIWNLWRAMSRSGEDSHESGWRRAVIEQFFGKPAADRLRLALMAFWRRERPSLRSERPVEDRNTYLTLWQLGLAGLAAEAEDPTWATKLTAAEARLALRYAPLELSGFPAWLDPLAAAHPDAVDEVLGAELRAELEEPLGPNWHSSLLQNIQHAPAPVATLFLDRLLSWFQAHAADQDLRDNRPAAILRLDGVLGVLLLHGGPAIRQAILERAVSEMDTGASGRIALAWLPAIFRLDAARGVETLEQALAETPVSARGVAIDWFGALFGDRHHQTLDLGAPVFTPDLLLRLARISYRHVRLEDDVEHEDAYSPDARDHAERGRSAVLSALFASTGPDAWAAKIALAEDPLFDHIRDRILAVARERSAEEADAGASREAEVVTLNRYGELPASTRDEMFALMSDRLWDLDDLLLRDDTPRPAWAAIRDEGVMRQQIARELRQMANHAYKVDQEATTADNKETDIRLRSVVSDHQAVIELKLGEKDRSAQVLRDALRDQLLKKYMAPETSRAGCLLVTVASDRTWVHPDTRASLDLSGLVAMLNAEAEAITREMGGEVRLMAKGLDLRPRLPTEKAAANAAGGPPGVG